MFKSHKILIPLYLILAVVYGTVWLFVLGLQSLGLLVRINLYGNEVAIQTSIGEDIFAILVFLIPASLLFIVFALVKLSPNLLRKARLLSKLLTFGLPIFVLLTSIIQVLRDGDDALQVFTFILTLTWLALVLSPLWLLNLFGGRYISIITDNSESKKL